MWYRQDIHLKMGHPFIRSLSSQWLDCALNHPITSERIITSSRKIRKRSWVTFSYLAICWGTSELLLRVTRHDNWLAYSTQVAEPSAHGWEKLRTVIVSLKCFELLDTTDIDLFFLVLFQITVYLGKRDFIDHLTHIDPIGKKTVIISHVTVPRSCSSAVI